MERVPVDDLSGDPAAVDEGLDGPAGLDTERRDGEERLVLSDYISPDGQLGPGVVGDVGWDGDSPTTENIK